MKYIKGDLFDSVKEIAKETLVVIPHVVNNRGGFGTGFVVPLAKHFPLAKESYHQWRTSSEFGLGKTFFIKVESNIVVAHMCAQVLGGQRPLYYNALAKCMDSVADYVKSVAQQQSVAIHAPAFGSGLAGGNWKFIEQLICDCWIRDHNLDVTIYYLPGTIGEQ